MLNSLGLKAGGASNTNILNVISAPSSAILYKYALNTGIIRGAPGNIASYTELSDPILFGINQERTSDKNSSFSSLYSGHE